MNYNEEVKLALLIQRVEQLAAKQDRMATDLDSLKSNALRISGGLAVMVIVASVFGWIVNSFGLAKIR